MKTLYITLILFSLTISCGDRDKKRQVKAIEIINNEGCFHRKDSFKIKKFVDSFITAAKTHNTFYLLQHIDFPLGYGAALQVDDSGIKINDENYISKDEFLRQIELIGKSQFTSKLGQSKLTFPDEYSNKIKDCYIGFMMQYQIHLEASILWTFERKNGVIKLVRYDIAG
ncbi:MAG TPA: hypothetical protein VEC12_02015 [Bacteroidia bacterium]|nr:hypothetical protein [Bacteroidia bacterium]